MTSRYEEVTFKIGILHQEIEELKEKGSDNWSGEEHNYYNYLQDEMRDLRREQSFIRSKGDAKWVRI